MKTVKSIKDTTLLRKHYKDVWTWKLDGSLIVKNKKTGKRVKFLKVVTKGK